MVSKLIMLAAVTTNDLGPQTEAPGQLDVTVTNNNGKHLPGTIVSVKGSTEATSDTFRKVVGASGRVDFQQLPTGTYSVSGELEGFNTVTKKDVTIQPSRTRQLTLILTPID